MGRILTISFFIVFAIVWSCPTNAKSITTFNSQKLYFIENKGQIKDQHGNPRNDIQYAVFGKGITIFIGDGQLHYQFSKQDLCQSEQIKGNLFDKSSIIKDKPLSEIKTYRMDVELVNANYNACIISEDTGNYYENYYLPGCLTSGTQAHTYKRIIYKDVYAGIDWVLHINGDKLEHEFIVSAGADASLIKLKYDGQTYLKLNEDGSINATTPMGIIKEKAPICYCADGSITPSTFKLQDNILSYEVNSPSGKLVIDPSVEWATYYGPDSSTSEFYSIACDDFAHVYVCGLTYAGSTENIATTGSYDASYAGGADAYLVKFDSSGNRIWATYYGGTNGDWGSAVTCDHNGNVYLGGSTSSTDSIATPGSQEPFFLGGLWCGFLVKFNSAGVRQWGTYVGGTIGSGFDLEVASVSCDLLGHVYVSGATDDTDNVATPGGFKPVKLEGMDTTVDCYLIQYDTAGVRQWGTYYGGPGRNQSYGGVNCNDGYSVYLSGWTNDTTSITIATPGSYQPTLTRQTDAFIVKFDAAGNRIWGTYYGGEGGETTGGIAYEGEGNLYLLGGTNSDSGIASTGSFQPVRGGGDDAFLAKFNVITGMRLWGTYYGGPGNEDVGLSRIITNKGNVYITGNTNSIAGISSIAAWQTIYGGGVDDAFFAAYDGTGMQQWSTYYGGTDQDEGHAIASDGYGLYLCGLTNSISNIATPGSFEPASGGGMYYYPGFLAKFEDTSTATLFINTKQNKNSHITLYPNPNDGSFILNGTFSNANGFCAITVTDILGNLVLKQDVPIDNNSIDTRFLLNNLKTGEYFLKVICNDNVSVLKFLKR